MLLQNGGNNGKVPHKVHKFENGRRHKRSAAAGDAELL